jgi:hypothetical protein
MSATRQGTWYAVLAMVALLTLCLTVSGGYAATFGITTPGTTNYVQTTVGNTTLGAQGVDLASYLVCCKHTTTVPLTAITIRTHGTVTSNVKVSIYDHDAVNNLPENLLFTQVASAVTGGSWSTINIPDIYLPAGTYWIAFNCQADYAITYITQGSGGVRRYRPLAYANQFPNPAPNTGWTSTTTQSSIYFIGVPVEGYAKATKATLPVNAVIQNMSFYSHATGNFRLAIYNDSGGSPSKPDTQLWESPSTAATAGDWTTVDISSGTPTTLTLNAGTYWLVWQWDSATSGPSYTAGSAGDGSYITWDYSSFPASWGSTSSSETWSIFASYTEPGPPIPEMATVLLFSTGLLVLVGYLGYRKKKPVR